MTSRSPGILPAGILPQALAVHLYLAAAYGPEIAEEVTPRVVSVLAEAGPALLTYADSFPDYFARSVIWRRGLAANKARWDRAPYEAASPEVRHARQQAAKAAGGTARGEANPSARLTDDLVRSIRKRRAAGESGTAIAADLGISTRSVSMIASRQRWAHVPDEA